MGSEELLRGNGLLRGWYGGCYRRGKLVWCHHRLAKLTLRGTDAEEDESELMMLRALRVLRV